MKKLFALILSVACVLTFTTCGGTSNQLLLASPSYPKLTAFPDMEEYVDSNGRLNSDSYDEAYNAWQKDRSAQQNQPEGYAEALEGYLRRSIPQLLSGGSGENRICSPLNVYMSLAMLAETTDGESRAQLLELLGSDGLESLRAEAAAVWNANYSDDGAVTSVLASSMWLSDSVKYKSKTVESLAENYYASVFHGEMGSDELSTALRNWINEQTGGLLSEQASGLQTPRDAVLALISTIYFRDEWFSGFPASGTEPRAFHSAEGDIELDFMHRSHTGMYYHGDNFTAHPVPLMLSGSMWLLLPDEGVTPEELIADEGTMDFLLTHGRNAERETVIVNLAVPKFDVFSDLELSDSLKALGITDVFDRTVSDFSPLAKASEQVYLSELRHAARVAIDEDGITATAYTISFPVAADIEEPPPTVDFVVDRPFVFAVTSHDGLPLFVGIVNQP